MHQPNNATRTADLGGYQQRTHPCHSLKMVSYSLKYILNNLKRVVSRCTFGSGGHGDSEVPDDSDEESVSTNTVHDLEARALQHAARVST